MEFLEPLLPALWREASRPVGLGESIAAMAQLLKGCLPVDCVSLRRIDPPRFSVETVAVCPGGQNGRREAVRTAYGQDDLEQMLVWCRRGEVLGRSAGDAAASGLAALVVPPFVKGEVLAGPLAGTEGAGILLLGRRPPERFTPAHRARFQALLEVFARAVENDGRLRELAALREAVEAERRSLMAQPDPWDPLHSVVGAEGGLRPVLERVAMVARSDVPVLILGETGSGKEVIARAIHTHSARADGPFIRVNCGAIPPELIDSELFGHEKGSFTGATATRRGWFERANTGTLLLDEIGELPAAAQVRLLRILQECVFERVGGERPIKADVRIVAATHRDLAAMVQGGQFREDLWYRIVTFPIRLPPLRERHQDIPALAGHFARQAARRFGLPPRMPTPRDIGLLLSYPWPGNVRELAVVMDRAAILGGGKCLEVAKALGMASLGPVAAADPAAPAPPQAGSSPAVVPLDQAVKRHIEAALAATRGRIEGPHGAAALLEINPHTLRARMRRLGIDWALYRAPAAAAPSPLSR